MPIFDLKKLKNGKKGVTNQKLVNFWNNPVGGINGLFSKKRNKSKNTKKTKAGILY